MRTLRINVLIITVILICIGAVMIYSASSIYAQEQFEDAMFFLKRHLLFLGIGAILSLLFLFIDYKKLKKFPKPLLILTLLLLVLILIPGFSKAISGARRWFRFGSLSFQPSEMANLVLIIYIADFLSRKQDKIENFFSGYLPVVLVLGLSCGLILLQPDLGTALAISIVAGLMLYIGGVRIIHLVSTLLLALPLLMLMIFSVPYRRLRIMAFLNPWQDPGGSGFQIIQSQIALGSGGFFGQGLGMSRQKLFFLPAAHTDFIFSIIGEELGFLGVAVVIILFVLLLFCGLKAIKNSPDAFGYYLGLGLILSIILRAFINISVVCGILPTRGLPLPFISYGGSSLIFNMASIALILNISRGSETL
ncbi:MAG: putative lipid II flippase FtsW [Candidatus Omnitrophica bacterium]|nr:putative lipid II flippase FtsW [Candidatus Omnitrophota bacterium]